MIGEAHALGQADAEAVEKCVLSDIGDGTCTRGLRRGRDEFNVFRALGYILRAPTGAKSGESVRAEIAAAARATCQNQKLSQRFTLREESNAASPLTMGG